MSSRGGPPGPDLPEAKAQAAAPTAANPRHQATQRGTPRSFDALRAADMLPRDRDAHDPLPGPAADSSGCDVHVDAGAKGRPARHRGRTDIARARGGWDEGVSGD